MASETLADILAEMRKQARRGQHFDEATIFAYAEHIEAAAERLREDVIAETVKAAAKSAAEIYEPHIHDEEPSNAAAMREALTMLRKKITDWYMNDWIPYDQYDECKDISESALAAPPRQCDVGTAEEQAKRFDAFCGGKNCLECPHFSDSRCELAWAQMPYDEGVSK